MRAKFSASRFALRPGKCRACGEQGADNLRRVPLIDPRSNQQSTQRYFVVAIGFAGALAGTVKQHLCVGNLLLGCAAVHARLFLHSAATCQGRLRFSVFAFDW